MSKNPFDRYWREYDQWYDDHESAYKAELQAVQDLLPLGIGLEIGVGTGRFAAPFQVKFGLDPSLNMLLLAKKRGIICIQGKGEDLPFKNGSFHFISIMVTICFLDDVHKVIHESKRTLKQGGYLIIGMINRNSRIGLQYDKAKRTSPFYQHARFLSPEQILHIENKAGFQHIDSRQTLFQTLDKSRKDETLKIGYNRGGFVVLKAQKI
jgi:SAM-dependent methyltransferase